MRTNDLVKVDLKTGRAAGRIKPSIELDMHRSIYNIRPDVNAIVHTHSPYTIGISISSKFRHVIEERIDQYTWSSTSEGAVPSIAAE